MERRHFLKSSALMAAGLSGFPAIIKASSHKPTLRVVGTHVTLQEKIRLQAEQDLGFKIEFYPGGSAEVLLKASLNPESFDLYEQWSNSIKVLWQSNSIQAIETNQITHWDEINDQSKKGRISEQARVGLGDAPNKLVFVQPDGSLGPKNTGQISFLPYVHNVDSFAYNASVIPAGIPYETESWSWLLDPQYQGRVAIVNEPTIGLFDLALAVNAQNLMSFKNMGNMTRAEIDQLFEIINDYMRRGHFRGVWTSVPHSVELMASGQTIIQSMFSPGVSTLNGMGIPCIYAAPKEGYRAWHGVMCLSKASEGEQKEMAYAFMNWWLSGWPGAFIARQGYYISNPQRSKAYMSPEEWDYWYEGLPATKPLTGTDGQISIQAGQVRTGGSYQTRFENVAVWNSVMDNYEYTLLKWNEFLLG